MACLVDFNGCDRFMGVITGKPSAFNRYSLLFLQNLSLLMCKCNENDSASGRLSGWSTAYLDFGQGRDTGLDRPLLSSHAVLSRVIEAKF